MSLSFGYPPLLLALALAAAGAFTYWTYRRTVPPLPSLRKALLAGLRFFSLALLILLLFEPVMRRLERTEQPPTLAVLVDNSQSLGPRAGASDSAQAAGPQAAVRSAVQDVLAGTEDDIPRTFFFGSEVEPVPGAPETLADSLDFSSPRTDIARALNYVRQELQQENLSGVLLISDGQYNTGRNPLHVADRYPVPIHTVVAGDTTRQRDLQIHRITTNEIAYAGTELPVQVSLQVEDYPGERVSVALTQSGQRLDAETINLPGGTAEVPVDLSVEPQGTGLQQFQVSVTELPGEATYRNNTATFTVRVLESKKQVLLLGAAPGPDVSAAHQLLEQEPNVRVQPHIQKQPGAFYQGPLPDDLSEIDAIVLAGYPGEAASTSAMQRLVEAAEADTPMLFLLTRQTDLAALQNTFQDVLPAVPEQVRTGFVEALMVPTPTGQQHPVLDLPSVAPSVYQSLPPLAYNESRWATSPDAQVLATTRVRGQELNDPLLVVRRRSGHRSAAFLGADTWRWQNLPEDLEAAAPLWPALFSNILQWISTPEDDRRVRVEPTREVFAGGEAVQFTGQVYNESLEPVENASVEVNVTTLGGKRYPYTMKAVGNGRYTLEIGSLPEGTYSYAAEASQDGTALGDDQGSFAVGQLTLEFRETRADAGLMRQLAQRSGGSFSFADNASTLPDQLRQAGAFDPSYLEETRETKLWHLYSLLGVIMVLLSAEWFFRKRSGLV